MACFAGQEWTAVKVFKFMCKTEWASWVVFLLLLVFALTTGISEIKEYWHNSVSFYPLFLA